MSSNLNFTSYMPSNKGSLRDLNGAASADTSDGDATNSFGYTQSELPFNGVSHLQQYQEMVDYDLGVPVYDPSYYSSSRFPPLILQPCHQLPQQQIPYTTSYDDSGITSLHSASHSGLLGGSPFVPYPGWFDPGSEAVSPSHVNTAFPMNQIQQSAPTMYDNPHFLALDEGVYHNASNTLSEVCLPPDLPLVEGTIPGKSDAVVGNIVDTGLSAPFKHMHRKGGKKGGPEERVHDCAYNGKGPDLEGDNMGYAKPSAIYQKLSHLKTEAFDYVIVKKADEAHAVGSEGEYVCRMRASIMGGVWCRDDTDCGEKLQDKDCYRRHLEEQHLGLHGRIANGKYVPIKTRIRRALDEVLKAEKEARLTKKRKRASEEEHSLGSSLSEEEKGGKKRRRVEAV